MKQYPLHKKQKNFLQKYLEYFISFKDSPSAHWEKVNLIVKLNIYHEEDRELLNKIREHCRYLIGVDYITKKSHIHIPYKPRTGKQNIQPGPVYSPHFPKMNTSNVSSAGNFTPSKGMMQRYATKMTNQKL